MASVTQPLSPAYLPQGYPQPHPQTWAVRPLATRFPWTSGILLLPLLATLMRIASPPTATLSYLVIAAYAFCGRRQAIIALYLCCLFNLMNHGFPGKVPSGAALLRFIVFFSAAFSVLLHGRNPRAPRQGGLLMITTFVMCLLIAMHSIAISPLIDVSLLKIISFTIVVMTIFAGWSWMDATERRLTEQMMLGGLMIVAIASLPLLRLSVGYMMNRRLFQGVLVHPNNFGPFMSILAIVLAMQCLTTRPLRAWRVAMLLVALLLVFRSGSRMSLLTFVGGLSIGFLAEMSRGALAGYRLSPRIVKGRISVAFVAVALLMVLSGPRVISAYKEFVQKGSKEVGSIGEAFQKSRGFLIEKLQRNIVDNPMTGIGFGIASDAQQWVGIDRDPIFGLPLMYTIEKGVMPLAVIEELGIPLSCLVFTWVAMLIAYSTRGGIVPLTAFCVALLTNLAESTLFSPGGMGLMILLIAGWSATAPPGGAWVRDVRRIVPVPIHA
jgi:hypothetical protein